MAKLVKFHGCPLGSDVDTEAPLADMLALFEMLRPKASPKPLIRIGADEDGAYLLPDDSLLEIAVSDAVIGEDVRLEGIGVQPDVSVPFSLPYAAGRDGQLDAAVEEMRRILARG